VNLSDSTFSAIAAFLAEIGLPVEIGEIAQPTFLPGIHAESGTLRVDPSKLSFPGDLLHEAGHLALLTAQQRAQVIGDAAAVHLQLDPAAVFHEHGYHGGSQSILQNFAEGRYIGVPMLQWLGLSLDPRSARPLGVEPYPHMLRWLRD
jgi:hypothetical protein